MLYATRLPLDQHRDGDAVPNTMADLIGDVFGAIAHIQEHAEYGGDPNKIAVTGDSAVAIYPLQPQICAP